MSWYLFLRHIHIASVVLSITLFIFRGGLMMADARLLQHRVLKVLPHVVDTVLLASAIGLSVLMQQYPFVHGWLTAKVVALLLYILLGTIAIKRGPTRRSRIIAFVLAVAVFAYILSVARAHHPAGFLLLLS